MTKAPLGGGKTGPNPTDRQLLEATLASLPVERPDPAGTPQNLWLDKGYSDAPSAAVAQAYGYELHVPDKANTKKSENANPGGGKRRAGSWRSPTLG